MLSRLPLFGALALLLAACTSPRLVDLGALYNVAARAGDVAWRPVVVVHGLPGSRLEEKTSGTIAWGVFRGDWADPEVGEGARLHALPMAIGLPLAELTDEVDSVGALGRVEVSLLGIPLGQVAYAYLLGALGIGGYRDQQLVDAGVIDYGDSHCDCFQFHYDWRRDLVESAHLLHGFLETRIADARRHLVETTCKDAPSLKVDLVAHSMGSLVVRYFLRFGTADLPEHGPLPEPSWAGAELVARAVLVAPPNAGAVEAFEDLLEGDQPGLLLPEYSPALLGTFPATHQLLPRGRHRAVLDDQGNPIEDLLDPALWAEQQWGLADPNQDPVLAVLLPDQPDPAERRRIALDHQRKCLRRAARIAKALDLPSAPPPGLDLHLVAGDAEPTRRTARLDADGEVEWVDFAAGDGTILRSSA